MTSVGIMASSVAPGGSFSGPSFAAQGPVAYSAAAGGSISPSLPVGWQPGQLAMAVVYNDDGIAALDEILVHGWARNLSSGTSPATARPVAAFLKFLQVGEPNPVFNFGSTPTDRHAYILTWNDVTGVNVFADYYSGTTNVTSATPSNITIPFNNVLLVQVGGAEFYGNCRMSNSNGFTSIGVSGTANGAGSTIVVQKQINAGDHSFPTYTWGTGSNLAKLSTMTYTFEST